MKEITFENVLSEFNNYIEKQNNYTPSYFKEFLDFLKNDIERMSKVLINEYFKLHIMLKYNYIKNGVFNVKQYQDDIQNILKDYITDEYEDTTNDSPERIKIIKDYFNIPQKAQCSTIIFQNKKTKDIMHFDFILMDSCSNKIENIYCIFHEYCHVLQHYFFLYNLPGTESEKLYIQETQADVFGYCATIIKLLQINNTDLLQHVLIDSLENRNIERGYFSFPIIKDIIYNLDKNEFLKEFTNEDNNIKYNVLFWFALEKVRQKFYEYDSNIKNSEVLKNELQETRKFLKTTNENLENYFHIKGFLFQNIRVAYSKKHVSLQFIENEFAKVKQKNLLKNYKKVEENIENFIKQEKEKVLE